MPKVWEPFYFLVGFCCFWCLVCWCVSWAGGWGKLAKEHASRFHPGGVAYYIQTAYIGGAGYSSCLTIRVCAEGVHLAVWPIFRVGHPPLLIPWTELENAVEKSRSRFWRNVEATVQSPVPVVIRLPFRIFEAAKDAGYWSAHRIGKE